MAIKKTVKTQQCFDAVDAYHHIEVIENDCMQAICAATHTADVIAAYQAAKAAQGV